MKIVNVLVVIVLTVIMITSCKKRTFEHSSEYITEECICCANNEEVVGTYKGPSYLFELIPGTGIDTLSVDTIVVNVARIDSTLDFISDSLYCFYRSNNIVGAVLRRGATGTTISFDGMDHQFQSGATYDVKRYEDNGEDSYAVFEFKGRKIN